MPTVLVTGAAGILGSHVADRLVRYGFDTVALTRPNSIVSLPAEAEIITGDVRNRADVDPLVKRVDVVVHAATSAHKHRSVDVTGSQMVAYACAENEKHLVYPSIVGIEHSTLPYYKAKLAVEQMIARIPGLSWTTQRATQFHSTIDDLLSARIIPAPPKSRLQPVDPAEVAGRLTGLVLAGPSERVADFGGPDVLTVRDLADIRRSVTGHAGRLLPLPAVGPLGSIAQGAHVADHGDQGTRSYRDWLEARA